MPENESDPRHFGYSRDKRGDYMQVNVALACETWPGNTVANTTLRDTVETHSGPLRRG